MFEYYIFWLPGLPTIERVTTNLLDIHTYSIYTLLYLYFILQ